MRTRRPIFYDCVWYGESSTVVWLQYVGGCGTSTIKVRRKYAESKAYVLLNTLKVQSSTVKVQYCTKTFFAPTVL